MRQFDCDIVQRNRGIDAILKKHYMNAPVAVKIQKKNETVEQAVRLLRDAGKKRNCSFTVLILQNEIAPHEIYDVPDNMIVLNSYELEIHQKIEQYMNEELICEPKKA